MLLMMEGHASLSTLLDTSNYVTLTQAACCSSLTGLDANHAWLSRQQDIVSHID